MYKIVMPVDIIPCKEYINRWVWGSDLRINSTRNSTNWLIPCPCPPFILVEATNGLINSGVKKVVPPRVFRVFYYIANLSESRTVQGAKYPRPPRKWSSSCSVRGRPAASIRKKLCGPRREHKAMTSSRHGAFVQCLADHDRLNGEN